MLSCKRRRQLPMFVKEERVGTVQHTPSTAYIFSQSRPCLLSRDDAQPGWLVTQVTYAHDWPVRWSKSPWPVLFFAVRLPTAIRHCRSADGSCC